MHKLPIPESVVASSSAISVSHSSSVPFRETRRDHFGAIASPTTSDRAEPLAPILVADDDPDDTFFIERLIKKTGVANPVRTFDDGTEVVNFLGGSIRSTPRECTRYPRLLFLDLKMRGLGGFGFLEWARKQKELGPLTIVVLSNSN